MDPGAMGGLEGMDVGLGTMEEVVGGLDVVGLIEELRDGSSGMKSPGLGETQEAILAPSITEGGAGKVFVGPEGRVGTRAGIQQKEGLLVRKE